MPPSHLTAFVVILSSLPFLTLAYTKIDLGELEWTVRSESQDIQVPAEVPGGIYTDLRNAGILDSPFYFRSNDADFRWVSHHNWTFSATFNIDHDIFDHKNILLDFKGIDTAATISVYGVEAARTDNMFRRYLVPVDSLVVLGSNALSVRIESPVSYSQRMFDEQLQTHYLVPPVCNQDPEVAECHANHIRKMQASFSWDWGPAFPSMGIWQPASLEAFNKAVLRYLKWNTEKSGDDWICTVSLVFDSDTESTVTGTVFVTLDGVRREFQVFLVQSPDNPYEATAEVEFSVPQGEVDLWWPNGSGEQKLYDLEVVFQDDTVSDISSMKVKVGFRTVEIIQEPLVQGLTFKFRINGIETFMKGSNWIPAHVLPEQVSREYLFSLLYSAKEAHMNMLRVWGGGIYELDSFYEIADELGLLIWQDHMFACSLYQANPENLINADLESQHQIRRLQHHASLALWAGNNENEGALRDNWYGVADEDFDRYYEDYVRLYVDTIMRRVAIEDPGRPFLISSPNNGDQTINEGFVAENPSSPIYGDLHYYNYVNDNWDYTTYPTTRFASEYGFQSFPSFEIIQTVSIPSDWHLSSEFMRRRQRRPGSTQDLLAQISAKMDLPSEEQLETEEGVKEFLYLTQVYQAVSMKVETEHYRRLRNYLDPVTGEGQCMGALYWQLNDIWPGVSWTSQEHGGKWKMSHYYAERMFRDIVVSPILNAEDDTLRVFLLSDSLDELMDLTLEIDVKRWDGFEVTHSEQAQIATFPPQSSLEIFFTDMSLLLQNGNCPTVDHCFLLLRISDSSGETIAENTWMGYPKNSVGLTVPNISVDSVRVDPSCANEVFPKCFNIDVSTDAVAPFVWIEALGIQGHFDDNGFLMDSSTKQLKFFCKDPNAIEQQIANSLQIRSYKNSFVK